MSGVLHSLLWRDAETARLFAPEAEIVAMLDYEAALARAQARIGLISQEAAAAIGAACTSFTPDRERLAAGIRRDGMAVPELIRALRASLPEAHRQALHLRSTSQDVIDTALTLRLRAVAVLLRQRLDRLLAVFDALAGEYGSVGQMGRTRMQRALPLTAGDRIAAWRDPFVHHLTRLSEIEPRLLVLQVGGPVGTDPGDWIEGLAGELGLGAPARRWHTARDALAEFAAWLSSVSGALGKLGQDIAFLAQNEIGEAVIDGGGTSSAMPHKSNPVPAEVLVALARFNATQLAGMHQALVHEQERSGTAWTLEWMILPAMIETTAAALATAEDLLRRLRLKPSAV